MSGPSIMKTAQSLIDSGESKTLQVKFGSREVKPGDKVPKGEAKEVPQLSWHAGPTGQKFIAINVDIDAPFPSFSPLGPALHWFQTGLTVGGSGDLTSSDPVVAFWAAPGPPPISSPHRYIFLLFEQPTGFDAKVFMKPGGYGIKHRMRWDLGKFRSEAKLGPAVAASYFFSN